MKTLQPIIIYRGATSEVNFDFTDFNFEPNSSCILTIKNKEGTETKFGYIFTEPKKYTVIFQDEETIDFTDDEYEYDIMYLVNDERYPQCAPSKVIVKEVVGNYEE